MGRIAVGQSSEQYEGLAVTATVDGKKVTLYTSRQKDLRHPATCFAFQWWTHNPNADPFADPKVPGGIQVIPRIQFEWQSGQGGAAAEVDAWGSGSVNLAAGILNASFYLDTSFSSSSPPTGFVLACSSNVALFPLPTTASNTWTAFFTVGAGATSVRVPVPAFARAVLAYSSPSSHLLEIDLWASLGATATDNELAASGVNAVAISLTGRTRYVSVTNNDAVPLFVTIVFQLGL